jgi:precorrin-4 methylase
MSLMSAFAYGTVTLTSTGVALNTETVTVGGKVYTFQTSLTNVDGNVLIGASASESLDNLKSAINLDTTAGVPGVKYATAMTANLNVKATTKTATTLVIQARLPGTLGNLIASTETLTNFSFGSGTLTGGTGSAAVAIAEIMANCQVNADVLQSLLAITA